MNMNIKQIIRAEPCLMILQVNVVLRYSAEPGVKCKNPPDGAAAGEKDYELHCAFLRCIILHSVVFKVI